MKIHFPFGKVLLFALIGFLIQLGFSMAITAMGALFLSGAGAKSLSYVYLGTPVLMGIMVLVSSWVLNRWGARGQLIASLAANVVLGIGLFVCFSNEWIKGIASFVISMLLVTQWLFILYSGFWNFADGFFDSREARQHYGKLSAGLSGGFALGSLVASFLADKIHIYHLFLVWSFASLASVVLIYMTVPSKSTTESSDEKEKTPSFTERLRLVRESLLQSPFALFLFVSFFIAIVMGLFAEYLYLSHFEYSSKLANPDRAEQELARTLGALGALMSILGLLMNLFGFSLLVRKIGVTYTAFLLPIIYLVIFAFVSVSISTTLALALMFTYQAFQSSIDINNQNILVKALPSATAKDLRIWLEGVGEPIAVAVVGFILLPELGTLIPGFKFEILSTQDIGLIGFIAALLGILSALGLHWHYRDAVQGHIRNATTKTIEIEDKEVQLFETDFIQTRKYFEMIANTPSSKRSAFVQRAHEIPLANIPVLLQIIQDSSSPTLSKSAALRIIGHRAPYLVTDFLSAHSRKIMAYCMNCIIKHDRESYALKKLWWRLDVLEHLQLLVEWNAIAGNLAEYDNIASALFDANHPSHGYALDALELGIDRDLFPQIESLLHWVCHPKPDSVGFVSIDVSDEDILRVEDVVWKKIFASLSESEIKYLQNKIGSDIDPHRFRDRMIAEIEGVTHA